MPDRVSSHDAFEDHWPSCQAADPVWGPRLRTPKQIFNWHPLLLSPLVANKALSDIRLGLIRSTCRHKRGGDSLFPMLPSPNTYRLASKFLAHKVTWGTDTRNILCVPVQIILLNCPLRIIHHHNLWSNHCSPSAFHVGGYLRRKDDPVSSTPLIIVLCNVYVHFHTTTVFGVKCGEKVGTIRIRAIDPIGASH